MWLRCKGYKGSLEGVLTPNVTNLSTSPRMLNLELKALAIGHVVDYAHLKGDDLESQGPKLLREPRQSRTYPVTEVA